ncbi:hypothetical protein GGQ22_02970 [Nocardioides sp. zg-579]|uniref:Lipoprotein n=1 Tax=Nocardioides marmotae TaxID=2663857 RepID=A0A6I3JAD4_9ACTN|nr:hypothetical protein [Nocardioides marmotae]MCR6030400.1 hypothetical protein [Gordonia jinghuaiqii]MTB94035.1 hypothetical protein [Nocardioides marmotae]QKE00344.1 hypothetical protein HPC71_04050 [Nocardioides marmotae]
MRRHLGTLALSAVLALAVGSTAACGEADGDPSESAVAGIPSPTQETVDPLDADGVESVEIKLVRGTDVGGIVTAEAVPVTEEADLEAFLEQFDPAFAEQVRTRVGQVVLGEEQGILAQVVAVGCESPTSATLRGNAIQTDVPKSSEECRAPVTTVALAVA